MATFRVGNRVRLKGTSERTGLVTLRRQDRAGIRYQVRLEGSNEVCWMTQDSLEPAPPLFAVGDQVSLRSRPTGVGVILDVHRRTNGNLEYKVFFGSDDQGWFPENSLRPFVPVDDSPIAADGSKFLKDMAIVKLRSNLSDTLYSYRASRTKVEPYQFKPAIKFFESSNQRLLIADEVGLGKTIEAGIIYLELKARIDASRILVICPSSLRTKWRDEMFNRFSEDFHILDRTGFREQLDRYQEHGDVVRFRAIVSMEAIRGEDIATLIEEVGLRLDLLIIDEAHHMRNASTLTHRIGRALADASDSVLLLSATPIHLHSSDLFNLFRILDEGQFDSFEEFEQMREPNIAINRASQLLSANPNSYTSALEALRNVESTVQKERFLTNPLYRSLCKRLASPVQPGHRELVGLQRDLQQINTFAPVFNRTTKRDVAPGVRRTPYVIDVELTPEERNFYDALVAFLKLQNVGILGIIQRERAAASCMAAARDYVLEFTSDPAARLQVESSDPDLTDDTGDESPPHQVNHVNLEELKAACDQLGDSDSKFDKFIEAMDSLRVESPDSKVLVFAFFRRTLTYLYERLREPGSPYAGSVSIIHGGVDPTERGRVIDRFREHQGFGVLLLSEVGAEGLDFQFCNTVVNYDLPWNPMRVEQRIGRVDRYGQESERIRVYSLVLDDTIEKRILGRLYERIRVFEESIGDLEAILGVAISRLQREVFQSSLTPAEEEERAEATLRAIEFKRKELDSFQQTQDRLMGQDIIFRQQFELMESRGKFISSSEVNALVAEFIKEACPKSSLQPNPRSDHIFTLRASQDLASIIRQGALAQRFPSAIMAPLREKTQNPRGFPVTFDGELGLRKPLLELLNLQHPIVHVAREYFDSGADAPPLSRLGIAATTTQLPGSVGEYAFFVYLVRAAAVERLSSLVPIVVDPKTRQRVEIVETDLMSALQEACYDAVIPVDWPWHELESTSREYFAEHRDDLQNEMETRNNAIIDTRIAGLRQTSEARVRRWHEALAQVDQPRIQRMRRSQISNEEARLQSQVADLESRRGVDISGNLVLAGYIRFTMAPFG